HPPSISSSEFVGKHKEVESISGVAQTPKFDVNFNNRSKIEEPISNFSRKFDKKLSNKVSNNVNIELGNVSISSSIAEKKELTKSELISGNLVNKLAPEKIVEFKENVEKNVATVRLLQKDSSSKVTLSRGNYDDVNGGDFRKVKAVSENDIKEKRLDRLPWVPDPEKADEDRRSKSKTWLAEKSIPEYELNRLRNVALRMKERIKVGAAGVTQALVDAIHDKWKIDEVVKLKFEGQSTVNMKRMHEVLESKTGGLVIWRSGSSMVLFRGLTYKLDCVQTYKKEKNIDVDVSDHPGIRVPDSARVQKILSEEESTEISELNNLLDELGPRFVDWSGPPPLPVDADLLPAVVPGYKTPFRLLPYGVRQCLKDAQTTEYRRIARNTHPHFALGRSRDLQGLAAAMVKLWEKSAIAKIAIKRGVLNTSNERMAWELKRLTRGTLLSRNKEYIVFYRGNDFLPPNVTKSLKERDRLSMLNYQEEEERRNAFALVNSNSKNYKVPMVAGTLAETVAANSRWGKQVDDEDVEKMIKDSALARHASLVNYHKKKLAIANQKLKKAEKALEKVQGYLEPEELPTDLETITDEERLVFRKIGLSMKPFLLVGRREVFDGTIENIHLHWKFRELVKVIVRGKNFGQVKHLAISLEAESGGVLVSIDKTTRGYAIILYRGKNYQQPLRLRPRNLLTRRQALARSIELQRREGLKHHISSLQEQMELLKSEIEDMKNGKEIDDMAFYKKLDDSSIPSDDEMEQDEDEEAYLQTYDSGDENSAFIDAESSQDDLDP
uniref:CRM domain-containing protein n=2 Tax=Chenopodium quinoa TaxID=63459 RepID=A0A803MGF7_CHEQI